MSDIKGRTGFKHKPIRQTRIEQITKPIKGIEGNVSTGYSYVQDETKPSMILCDRCDGYGCTDDSAFQRNPELKCKNPLHKDWDCWICRKCHGMCWIGAPLMCVVSGRFALKGVGSWLDQQAEKRRRENETGPTPHGDGHSGPKAENATSS